MIGETEKPKYNFGSVKKKSQKKPQKNQTKPQKLLPSTKHKTQHL